MYICTQNEEGETPWYFDSVSYFVDQEALLLEPQLQILRTMSTGLFISGLMITMQTHATHTEKTYARMSLQLFIMKMSENSTWTSLQALMP